jgi:hypothetical protein
MLFINLISLRNQGFLVPKNYGQFLDPETQKSFLVPRKSYEENRKPWALAHQKNADAFLGP